MQTEAIERRWLTIEGAAIYSGLSGRTIQNYVKDGLVRSSNVITPGATRGRRLIDRESLDKFIESGLQTPKTELKMNVGREPSQGGAH